MKFEQIKNEKRGFALQFLLLLLVFAFSFPVFGQETKPNPVLNRPADAEVVTLKLNSKLMAREMSYNVVFPAGYRKKPESRFPVIYLLHGLMGHFNNWTDKTKIAQYAVEYDFIIVTPEGGDGWYTDSASENNDRYESYIVDELIPEIDKKFRTAADKKQRAIAGLSMGGYGSIKFGLKYPELFSLVGSFSGALNVAILAENEVGTSGVMGTSIMGVFGKSGSETRKENDIFQIVRDIPREKIKDLPFIYLACGTEDFVFKPNREFSELLLQKKIPHEYRQLPGKHNWDFWDAQAQEFLRLSEKYVK